MKKLLIFGDSWPNGAELEPNQHTFGELLAYKIGVPMTNCSNCSTSIPHLLLQLRKAVTASEKQIDYAGSDAIFFLTSPDRDIIWKKGECKELHLNPNHSDIDLKWYTEFWTPELTSFRVNTTLLALEKLCEIHKINDHYIWGWQRIDLWPEINRDKFWRHGESSLLDLFKENDKISCDGTLIDYINHRTNKFIYPNQGHPNQLGHHLIADALEAWLVHKI
jgi:hypothetical protein